MEITKELLREWEACADGYAWFLKKFPQGGDVYAVCAALRSENRFGDAGWLTSRTFDRLIRKPSLIGPYVMGGVNFVVKEAEGSPNSASGHQSTAASSGNYSTAASSGDSSTAASSGYSSTAASSGDSSTAASSGSYSKAEAKGEKTIAMVAGCGGLARAGEKGAFALAWLDGGQMRIAVGAVGENGIKADTWYMVEDGVLVQA